MLVAAFPFIEWVIHVGILRGRPRKVRRIAIDSLLARKHRAHHADPRDVPLVFVPWQVFACKEIAGEHKSPGLWRETWAFA